LDRVHVFEAIRILIEFNVRVPLKFHLNANLEPDQVNLDVIQRGAALKCRPECHRTRGNCQEKDALCDLQPTPQYWDLAHPMQRRPFGEGAWPGSHFSTGLYGQKMKRLSITWGAA
jgi:hypothetical protein